MARLVLAGDAALIACALLSLDRPWTGVAATAVVAGLLALMQHHASS